MKNFKMSTGASSANHAVKESLWMDFFGSAIFLTVLTSTAYLVGVVFHQTYMRTLKLNYELYPKGSSDYFIYAFSAFLQMFPAWFQAESTELKVFAMIVLFFVAIVLIHQGGKFLGESDWMKSQQQRASKSKKFQIIGTFLYVPILGVFIVYYLPILLTIVMTVPVFVGDTMGRKIALEDKANFAEGCVLKKKQGFYCTLVSESGKKIALGFIVDASEKYFAIIEDGKARSIPIEDKIFSEYTASDNDLLNSATRNK